MRIGAWVNFRLTFPIDSQSAPPHTSSMATTSPSTVALQTAAPLTTARLREQAAAAEARLDWTAAADLWRLARERYPLMPGRQEHGPLALADMENMRRFEATCRAMAEEQAAEALPPALVMRDLSASSISSGQTYYLLCPGGAYLEDAEGRIQRFEHEQDAMDEARRHGWAPIADSGLPRGREWGDAHATVYGWGSAL